MMGALTKEGESSLTNTLDLCNEPSTGSSEHALLDHLSGQPFEGLEGVLGLPPHGNQNNVTLFGFRQLPDTISDAHLIVQDKISLRLGSELELFVKGVAYSSGEPHLLTKFKKKSKQDADLPRYRFERDAGTGLSDRFSTRFYGAPYTFVLCYDNMPIASISFKAEKGAVLVTQIQGVKGAKDKLKPIKWGRALLAVVCDWAARSDVPEVRVLPHYRSRFSRVREHGKLLYDVPAKRSGFTYDGDMGVYRKLINPICTDVP